MFFNILKTNILFAFIVIGIFSSNAMAQDWGLPRYYDNSQCLLKQSSGCLLMRRSVYIEYKFTEQDLKNTQLTDGAMYFHWLSYLKYSDLMKSPDLGNGFRKLGSDHKVKITDVLFKVDMVVVNKDNPNLKKDVLCQGSLHLSGEGYKNNMVPQNGLKCPIERGYFPYSVTIRLETPASIEIVTNNSKIKDRMLEIPALVLEVQTVGYAGCLLGTCHTHQSPKFTIKLLDYSDVKLNDRRCKVDVNEKTINFGTINSSVVGKASERAMPLIITCSGYNDGEDNRHGLGIVNNIVSMKVNTTSDYFPKDKSHKSIGLTTSGKLRDDLYVEGSFEKGQECKVNPLFTDNTGNRFGSDIVVGSQDPQTLPEKNSPVIYWRLCSDPSKGGLKPGGFTGGANISIEYE